MPQNPSRLGRSIIQSEIRNMSLECAARGGINLAQGVCDTPMPRQVAEAACLAIGEGLNSYTHYKGLIELRQSIAGKMRRYNNVITDPETEVVVSAGATGAFYCACLSMLNKGDEVILFEPYYGYHFNTLKTLGMTVSLVTLRPPGWEFSPAELEKAVSARTRAIVVCTPSNPCGKVFTRAELKTIAEFAAAHDLLIITDEIYEYFLYDNNAHISPMSLPEIAGRAITISGYSKTFNVTGWRIGYCVAQRTWADIIGQLNDLVYVCAPAPLQLGVAAGIDELKDSYYSSLRESYQKKRDLICNSLQNAGLKPCIPQGSYYVLADVSGIKGRTGKEKAINILEKTGVAGVPGSAFFRHKIGENFIRFCFAKSDPELTEACRRLEKLGG